MRAVAITASAVIVLLFGHVSPGNAQQGFPADDPYLDVHPLLDTVPTHTAPSGVRGGGYQPLIPGPGTHAAPRGDGFDQVLQLLEQLGVAIAGLRSEVQGTDTPTATAGFQQGVPRLQPESDRTPAQEPAVAAVVAVPPPYQLQSSVLARLDELEDEVRRLTGTVERLEFDAARDAADFSLRVAALERRMAVAMSDGSAAQSAPDTLLVTSPRPLAAGDELVASNIGPEAAIVSGQDGDAADMPADRDTVVSAMPGTSILDEAIASSHAEPEVKLQAAGPRVEVMQAMELLESGDHAAAIEAFKTFRDEHDSSIYDPEVLLGLGHAYHGAGNTREAARTWLEAYSVHGGTEIVDDALFLLGRSLGEMDRVREACLTLAEVPRRFPASPFAPKANAVMTGLECGA